MSFSNRIFNVNGGKAEHLRSAIDLVFAISGHRGDAQAWRQTKTHGLVFYWWNEDGTVPFPDNCGTPELCALMAENWLKSEFAKTVELSDFCDDADHDGHNEEGWQVYCEDWGHVDDSHYAIFAVKPAFVWFGK